ncbi:MAG: AsmA-like C-terminal region-containing protein [Paludibacter sp.]|nr:AsmA-like C-terminal region-containing protein [Paludibacter sp.]
MNKKVKNGLIISLSVIVVFIAALIILPYAFKDKITKLAKEQVNTMFNATVNFEDVNISFLRSFPNASVKLENFSIVGIDNFKNDTLLSSQNIDLIINIKSLFSDTGYEIGKLQFNNPKVFAHVLPSGVANWSIMKEDTTQQAAPDTSSMSFNLKIKDFVIKDGEVIYLDEAGNMSALLQHLNHQTSGDLTADSSLLVTETTIDSLDFWMDGVKYLSKANVELNADINANINKMLFTFSKNSSRINAIPFSFSGWFQMPEEGYDMDLTLNAEKVDFKAILSMIPAIYAESFEGIKSGGAVDVSGFIKGKMIDDFYPAFDFKLSVVNGWFQYPNLPKSLQNINIAGHISNPGKTLDETIIDLSQFSFLMGGNPFSAQMHIAYPMSDPELKLKAIGKIDLANIAEIYPLESDTKLNGELDMNLNLGGRMSYYDNNLYDKFIFDGKLDISNMQLKMKQLSQEVIIDNANMEFNNRYADLTALKMKIGRNDLTATGKLENFVAYALHDKTLKGTLNMQSNYFNVSDFMSSDNDKPAENNKKATSEPDTSKLSVIEIPKNLEFTMNAGFKQLVYDKMDLTNAKGVLKIADGIMSFKDLGFQAFGGNLLMNGQYNSTNPQKPSVNFDISINEVIFKEIVKQVETLQKFVPVFENAVGKFSTKLSFNSLLQSDMMPDLASVIGNGTFTTKSIGLSNVPALTALGSSLKINELTNTTIKDLGLIFDIKDGKLNTKPFDVKLGNVKMNIGGSTGLDKTINYSGKVQLPDNIKLGKLSTVNVKIGGTFTKPKIALDMASTINALVDDNKAKVATEVNKQIDNAKDKALAEAQKQKENAIKAAQVEADKIKAEAQKLGDQLIAEAQKQGDVLIAKTNNPIAKKVAEVAAKKSVDEAKKKAADLNAKAEVEANKVIQKAANEVKI